MNRPRKPQLTRFQGLAESGFPIEHRGPGWYILMTSEKGYAKWEWYKKCGPKPKTGDYRTVQLFT